MRFRCNLVDYLCKGHTWKRRPGFKKNGCLSRATTCGVVVFDQKKGDGGSRRGKYKGMGAPSAGVRRRRPPPAAQRAGSVDNRGTNGAALFPLPPRRRRRRRLPKRSLRLPPSKGIRPTTKELSAYSAHRLQAILQTRIQSLFLTRTNFRSSRQEKGLRFLCEACLYKDEFFFAFPKKISSRMRETIKIKRGAHRYVD